MRWAVVFLCLALVPSFAAPTKKSSVNKGGTAKVAASTSHTTTTVQRRGTRSRKGRRAVRAKSAVSYQSHPDPERYQQIQQALSDRGYFKGQVNGQWNDDSVDALRRFQMDQKLPDAEGKLDALSLRALGLGPKHGAEVSAPAAPVPPLNSSASPVTPPPGQAPESQP